MEAYLDIIIRSVAVYFFMLIALRLFGKKELSQLNTSDVILILLISNAVQNAMVGNNTTLLGGILAALVLFVVNYIFKKIMYNSKLIRDFIQGKPEILIHNGKIDFKTLHKLGINFEELEESIHEHGVENYKDIKLAIFEINGNISIISGNKNLRETHHKRKVNKPYRF